MGSGGLTIMSEGNIKQWYHEFTKCHTNVHIEDRHMWPSLVGYDLVEQVNAKFKKTNTTQKAFLSMKFHKFHSVQCITTITEVLGNHKLYAKWIQKWLMHIRNQRIAST